eukprot:TRINITY_DN16786_c0_g1_i4.p1 TRINITY_DN16786_c0_g1~~TRINITY_DN16786_c0_g1_i4.p1  ORF type:complete len:1004 (-),score=157.35 TRINITY_DN16786_c0_g1_i4:245-3211(-)
MLRVCSRIRPSAEARTHELGHVCCCCSFSKYVLFQVLLYLIDAFLRFAEVSLMLEPDGFQVFLTSQLAQLRDNVLQEHRKYVSSTAEARFKSQNSGGSSSVTEEDTTQEEHLEAASPPYDDFCNVTVIAGSIAEGDEQVDGDSAGVLVSSPAASDAASPPSDGFPVAMPLPPKAGEPVRRPSVLKQSSRALNPPNAHRTSVVAFSSTVGSSGGGNSSSSRQSTAAGIRQSILSGLGQASGRRPSTQMVDLQHKKPATKVSFVGNSNDEMWKVLPPRSSKVSFAGPGQQLVDNEHRRGSNPISEYWSDAEDFANPDDIQEENDSEADKPEKPRMGYLSPPGSPPPEKRGRLSDCHGTNSGHVEAAFMRNSANRFDVRHVWCDHDKKRRSARSFALTGRSSKLILLDEDAETRTGCARLMIHPNSSSQVSWNVVSLVLIAYDVVMLPLELFEPPRRTWSTIMEILSICFWTVNIVLSFFVGYVGKHGAIEMQPAKVAKRYLLTWFGIDLLVSSVDWGELVADGTLLPTEVGRVFRGARSLRILRTMRVFRMMKAKTIIDSIISNIRSEKVLLLANVLKIMCIMFVIVHLIGCAWYGIGYYISEHEHSWLIEAELIGASLELRYCRSMHWSLSAFTGTTLYMPKNYLEQSCCVFFLFLSFMVAASVGAFITTHMTRLQLLTSQQSTQIAKLKRYLADHGISRTLALRVQRNAQHAMVLHERNMSEASVELLKIVSEPLRVELHYEVHSVTLMMHPFFDAYSTVNPMGLRKVCHAAVCPLSLSSGDVLFSYMEESRPRMLFIINGRLIYEKPDVEPINVRDGQWLCEAPLWTHWFHVGTTRAFAESQLLSLDADKFAQICASFPSEHALNYAQEFVGWLNHAGQSLTDIGEKCEELDEMIEISFPHESEDEELNGNETPHRNSANRTSRSRYDGSLFGVWIPYFLYLWRSWKRSVLQCLRCSCCSRRRGAGRRGSDGSGGNMRGSRSSRTSA